MKRIIVSIILSACGLILPSVAAAQEHEEAYAKEVYTGTIVNVSGRMATVGFTLHLTGRTSDEEARNYLAILGDEGQDGLMKAIRNNNLGYIAATGQTRRDLLIVREAVVDGKRRVIAAFERWQGFFELRSGSRSLTTPSRSSRSISMRRGRDRGPSSGWPRSSLSGIRRPGRRGWSWKTSGASRPRSLA